MRKLQHSFVEYMPDVLEPDVLYISLRFGLISHRCCCGCGEEVVLKLSSTDWRFTHDGETITIRPSVGNWSLPCRSHYLITESSLEWSDSWTDEEVRANRAYDQKRKAAHARGERLPESPLPPTPKRDSWFKRRFPPAH